MMGQPRIIGWKTMDKASTDLSVVMKHFEVHNRTEGKSIRTVEWYNEVLGLLYRWLREQGAPTSLGSIDEMTVREFILDFQGRPGNKNRSMSSHSVYNRVNALRSFFAWLSERAYTEEHVLKNLKQPRTADVIIEPLTREEIEALLSAVNPNTFLGSRNAALISLMLDTGLPGNLVKKKVKIGDMVVLRAPFERIGDAVVSQCLDNRVACWIAMPSMTGSE